MPWKRHLYPDNWEEIAYKVKEAAGWKCERCGHPHDPAKGRTLTVHHLDGDPRNCKPENLAALCQKCHLIIQIRFRPFQTVMPFGLESWMLQRTLPTWLKISH